MNGFSKIALGLAALGAVALSSGASHGADMQLRKAPQQAQLDCVWCGFYLGGDLAYAFDTTLRFDVAALAAGTTRFDPKGIMYGGHLGYLSQHGVLVLGIETEFLLGNMAKTNVLVVDDGEVAIEGSVRARIDYIASVTGSLGLLAFENTRLYVKGGPAWGHATGNVTVGGLSFEAPANHFGWVAGGGIDLMLGRQWMFGLEYKHFDLGNATYAFNAPLPVVFHSPLKADVVTARLSYRFGQ